MTDRSHLAGQTVHHYTLPDQPGHQYLLLCDVPAHPHHQLHADLNADLRAGDLVGVLYEKEGRWGCIGVGHIRTKSFPRSKTFQVVGKPGLWLGGAFETARVQPGACFRDDGFVVAKITSVTVLLFKENGTPTSKTQRRLPPFNIYTEAACA